jgi:ATP-dependent RNA helicase RhlB
MQFSEFNLIPDLLKGIEEAGYAECTEVQQETLQHTLAGRDVFVQSQTGTGKTAAFLISLFELMARNKEEHERAIIISPTRELAVQIAEEAKLLSLYMDLNIVTVYGGVGYTPQIKAIADGIDILIGTPGRLIDMSDKRMLNLHQFSYAVIDEADRMFDMGFVHDVQTILRRLPSREARQTMLFSATLSTSVKQLASQLMNEPSEVHIESENITVDTIEQQVYHVGSSQKIELLLGLLKKYPVARVLIFVNMKHMAEELSERLNGNGFTADYLTGDLPQNQRLRRIDRFKNNELPILIATDVAARGIHVDDLELVVNYDIPMHSENYVHRIGRTARAGKSGRAITLACETFVEFLAPIEKFIQMKIPSVVAEEDLYIPDATAGRHFRRQRRPSGNNRSNDRSGRSGDRYGSGRQRSGSRNYSSGRSDSRGRSDHRGGNDKSERSNSDRRNGSGDDRQKRYGGNRKERYTNEQNTNSQRQTNSQSPNQNPNRQPRKNEEGRIPASHAHDGRSFEKHQHPAGQPQHRKETPEKKKGLFAKVLSLFK